MSASLHQRPRSRLAELCPFEVDVPEPVGEQGPEEASREFALQQGGDERAYGCVDWYRYRLCLRPRRDG
jgi:hypothetical protein